MAKQNHVAIHFARVEHIVVLGLAGDYERATGLDCHCQQTGAGARNHRDACVAARCVEFAIVHIAGGKS